MQRPRIRRIMLTLLVLAAAGVVWACSEGPVGYEKAAQIEDRINTGRRLQAVLPGRSPPIGNPPPNPKLKVARAVDPGYQKELAGDETV